MNVKVGHFSRPTATGSQSVTGLGFQPKAIIFFCQGDTTADSFTANQRSMIGFATASGQEGAISVTANDAANPTNNWRLLASKAVSQVDTGGGTLAQASFTSFDSGGFTLNWTTVGATASVVQYLAIGGADISAKVVQWNSNTSIGNQAITGVGFKPDWVMTFGAGGGTVIGTAGVNSFWGWGVMDAAGNQWSISSDGTNSVSPSVEKRGQLTTGFYNQLGAGQTHKCAFVSMDTDGFTGNWNTAPASTSAMFSLCVKGSNAKVGTFSKTTSAAPVTQAVTGTGFTPSALFFSSYQQVAGTLELAGTRAGIGATDGTANEANLSTTADAVTTSVAKRRFTSSHCFQVADNDTSTLEASAEYSSFDSGGFTLNWSANNATATQVGYIAIGTVAGGQNSLTGNLMTLGVGV